MLALIFTGNFCFAADPRVATETLAPGTYFVQGDTVETRILTITVTPGATVNVNYYPGNI